MTTISSLSRLTFCQYSREEPAFCTILPFYFACQLIIFCAQLPAFSPPKSHFLGVILPFSAMYFMSLRGYIYTIAVCFYAFWLAFSRILHRI